MPIGNERQKRYVGNYEFPMKKMYYKMFSSEELGKNFHIKSLRLSHSTIDFDNFHDTEKCIVVFLHNPVNFVKECNNDACPIRVLINSFELNYIPRFAHLHS